MRVNTSRSACKIPNALFHAMLTHLSRLRSQHARNGTPHDPPCDAAHWRGFKHSFRCAAASGEGVSRRSNTQTIDDATGRHSPVACTHLVLDATLATHREAARSRHVSFACHRTANCPVACEDLSTPAPSLCRVLPLKAIRSRRTRSSRPMQPSLRPCNR